MRMQKICLWIILEIFINAHHSVLEMTKKKLTEKFQRVQRFCSKAKCCWINWLLLKYFYRLRLLLNRLFLVQLVKLVQTKIRWNFCWVCEDIENEERCTEGQDLDNNNRFKATNISHNFGFEILLFLRQRFLFDLFKSYQLEILIQILLERIKTFFSYMLCLLCIHHGSLEGCISMCLLDLIQGPLADILVLDCQRLGDPFFAVVCYHTELFRMDILIVDLINQLRQYLKTFKQDVFQTISHKSIVKLSKLLWIYKQVLILFSFMFKPREANRPNSGEQLDDPLFFEMDEESGFLHHPILNNYEQKKDPATCQQEYKKLNIDSYLNQQFINDEQDQFLGKRQQQIADFSPALSSQQVGAKDSEIQVLKSHQSKGHLKEEKRLLLQDLSQYSGLRLKKNGQPQVNPCSSKNFLPFIWKKLKKFFQKIQELKSNSQLTQLMQQEPTLENVSHLFCIQEVRAHLNNIFRGMYLVREIMKSIINPDKKIIYLKFLRTLHIGFIKGSLKRIK